MGKTAGRAVSSADLLRDRKKCMFSEEILYIYYEEKTTHFRLRCSAEAFCLLKRSCILSDTRRHRIPYRLLISDFMSGQQSAAHTDHLTSSPAFRRTKACQYGRFFHAENTGRGRKYGCGIRKGHLKGEK